MYIYILIREYIVSYINTFIITIIIIQILYLKKTFLKKKKKKKSEAKKIILNFFQKIKFGLHGENYV